jgi:hypothetical protein
MAGSVPQENEPDNAEGGNLLDAGGGWRDAEFDMKTTGYTLQNGTRGLRALWGMAWMAVFLWAASAAADVITGADWRVTFNRPDQTTTLTSIGTNEFDIRDRFVACIEELQSGDAGYLATYTLTGSYAQNGAAGPILAAVSNALARGARLGFVAGGDVDLTEEFWPGCSLNSLSKRPGNALEVARAPAQGIMHNKVGVFFYRGRGESRLLTASWNFTAWASSRQWNILTEFSNHDLACAYSNELRQMLNGYFHSNPDKSRVPQDKASFDTANTTAGGWVRFAPYPSGRTGGDNAETEITNRIAQARQSIWFALNKQTRAVVTDQLIAACDRGVEVHGVVPVSDRAKASNASFEQYQRMQAATNYATTNRIHLHEAYYKCTSATDFDTGLSDLVHCKYMVIDPFGPEPWVIHGSANWTWTALVTANTPTSNDENLLFIPDGGVARAFLAQFAVMTGVEAIEPPPSDGVRLALAAVAGTQQLQFTIPAGLDGMLVGSADLQPWAPVWSNPVAGGVTNFILPRAVPRLFFRIEKAAPSGAAKVHLKAPALQQSRLSGADIWPQPLTNGGALAVTVAPEILTAIGEGGVEYTVTATVENSTEFEISHAAWTVVPTAGTTNAYAGLQAEDGQSLVLIPAPEDGGGVFDVTYLVVVGEGAEAVSNSATCRLTVLNPRRVDFETLGPFSGYPTNYVVDDVTGQTNYVGITTNLNGMDWKFFNVRRSSANRIGTYSAQLRHYSSNLPGLLESEGWFDGIGSISVHMVLFNTTGFLTFVVETQAAESGEWVAAGEPCRVEVGGDISNQVHTVDVNRSGLLKVRLRTTGGYNKSINIDNLMIRPYGDLVPYLEVAGAPVAAVGQEYELAFRVVNGDGAPRIWTDYGVALLEGAGEVPVFEEVDGNLCLAFTPTAADLGKAFMATGTVSIYGRQYTYSTNWTFTVAAAPEFELRNASPQGRTILYTNEILDVWSTNVVVGGVVCTNNAQYTASWTVYPPFATNTVSQYNRYRVGGGLMAADVGNHDVSLSLTDKSNGLTTTHSLHFLVLDREPKDPRYVDFEEFGDADYDSRTVNLSGRDWNMAGVCAGWSPEDVGVGTTAARLQCPAEGVAFLESQAAFDGIGYIEFACAGHAGSAGGAVQMWIQLDGTSEFVPLGNPVVPTRDLTWYRTYAGVTTLARVRLEVSGAPGQLVNVDELKIGEYRPEERIVVVGALEIPAGSGFELQFVATNLVTGVTTAGISVLRDGWDVTQYDGETPHYFYRTAEETDGKSGSLFIRILLSSGYELATNVEWRVLAADRPHIEGFQLDRLTVWSLAGWSNIVFAVTNLGGVPHEADWVWALTNVPAADGSEDIVLPGPDEPPASEHDALFYGIKTLGE